ncbi:diphthamide synthesis protein [Candidatus Woesearchaeota archaeon]|nr:diphthamide synthesis protein [Candidatus Woesearchaeota archaeon]
MKLMIVEGRYKGNITLDKAVIAKLPKRIGLTTTVQFIDQMPSIKAQLEAAGKSVETDKKRQAYHGQLLGCDSTAGEFMQDAVDAFLYVGTGLFHPINLGMNVNKEVYLYDPFTKKLELMDKGIARKMQQKRQAFIKKFHAASNIGILVSMKSGQGNFEKGMKLKKELEKQEKHAYLFVFETLDFSQPENFPFIECWVNTACPRIFDDYEKFSKPLVNMDDISSYGFHKKLF